MSRFTYDPQYLYVTTTGWKSGNPHEIEIWFVAHEDRYYLISENSERTHWVQNIRQNPAVTFHVEGQTRPGTGRLIDDMAEPELARIVRALMQDKYRWSTGQIVELVALDTMLDEDS